MKKLLIILMLPLLFSARLNAEEKVLPLAGIQKIYLLLLLDEQTHKVGVTGAVVRADVAARLAVLNIPVEFVFENPGLDETKYPLLLLEVTTGQDKKWYRPDTFMVTASLKEMVRLQRDSSIRASASLWHVAEHGYDNRVIPAIRKSLMRLADSFSLAWAKANPQKLDPAKVLALPPPAAAEKDPLAE